MGGVKATETAPRLCSFMHKPENGAQHEDLAQAADVEFSEHTQEESESPRTRDQPAHAPSAPPQGSAAPGPQSDTAQRLSLTEHWGRA